MIATLGRVLTVVAKRSAARKYARYLGPALQRSYGPGQHYTASQISAGARKARLPQDHIEIGFAAFMPQDAFASLSPLGDYHALRALYLRFARAGRLSSIEPAEANPYALSAYPSTSTSDHSPNPAQHG